MKCHCESCSKDPLPTYTEKFKRESFVREIASREGESIRAYYNEFDPKAAAWLRQLIKNGDITQGEVDERSITEVKSGDLRGFDRVHFFAGIGTWDYCLNQAGWGNKPIWTASLPCQPFSAAGKGLGKADERHLLPHFINIVRECKPSTILGEQVAAAIGHGWLDDLYTEMEACDYAIGSAVIGAHSVGAPHIRQRLYWVANSNNERLQGRSRTERADQFAARQDGLVGGLANSESERIGRTRGESDCASRTSEVSGGHENRESVESNSGSAVKRMVHSDESRPQQGIETAEAERYGNTFEPASGFEWIYCRDNKHRPIKPGIQPLVDGVARGMVYSSDPSAQIDPNKTAEARAMRLKGYGNAIQTQTAIAFITAFMSV